MACPAIVSPEKSTFFLPPRLRVIVYCCACVVTLRMKIVDLPRSVVTSGGVKPASAQSKVKTPWRVDSVDCAGARHANARMIVRVRAM